MSRFHLSRIVALPALALAMGAAPAVAAAGPAAAGTTYSVTSLGSLGFGLSIPLAINATGEVTGYSYLSRQIQVTCPPQKYGQPKKCFENLYHAFSWSNGTMTDLGTLGGDFSEGLAINSSGEVVGWAQTKAGIGDPFLFNGRTMTDLTSLGVLHAYGINDSGQIAGTCGPSTGPTSPCVVGNGRVTDLPNPPNFSCGVATAINNNGQVIGECEDSSGNGTAVVWTNGTPTVLGSLGGPYFNATGLNNLGQVTGFGQTSTDAQHGFLWSNGTFTDLGNNFFAAAINDSAAIVAGDEIYSGGAVQNLNNLVPAGSPQIDSAIGINDNGQIVVVAPAAAGHTELLTPN